MTINKVILIGFIDSPISLRYFERGKCVGHFRLKTSESFVKNERETVYHQWHQMVISNQLAEYCEAHLGKGDHIYCEGKIKNRYIEERGNGYTTTEIHIMTLQILKKNNHNPN